MVNETHKTNSGIHIDSNGNRVIGGSLRADGSTRKVVKVREGYTPTEDVERYRPKKDSAEGNLNAKDNHNRRPRSRFAGLNELLHANNEVNSSKIVSPEITKFNKNNIASVKTTDIESVTKKISAIDLDRNSESTITTSSQPRHFNQNTKTQTVKPSSPIDNQERPPSKKPSYKPPHQRQKKVSLEELNQSLGIQG